MKILSKNHLIQKAQERIYAETAAKLMNSQWTLGDIEEPLDFEIQQEGEKFGLEIRQIFIDSENRSGSPSKKKEAENMQLIYKLADQYYSYGGTPILAKFLGLLSKIDLKLLAEHMRAAAPAYPGPNITINIAEAKIFITPLPTSFSNYSRWVFINDKLGWINSVTSSALQHVINQKESRLSLYKKKYESIDLLLVADRSFNSGKLTITNNITITNPGFRTIYFMSYPDSIQRIS